MKPDHEIQTLDTHTAGMPTRIVVDGVDWDGDGESVADQRDRFAETHDWARELLMQEPRGHRAMYGAMPVPPADDSADLGVFFFDAHKYADMCGHGTMGVVTGLIERGHLEPKDEIRVETPAGTVLTNPRVGTDGTVEAVAVRNVESYPLGTVTVPVPGAGPVAIDVVYSGNVIGLLDVAKVDASIRPDSVDRLTGLGTTLIERINDGDRPVDPITGEPRSVTHLEFYDESDEPDRNVVVSGTGLFDRSPCGTGTCAKMTHLYADDRLDIGESYVHESIIGTTFEGHLSEGMERAGTHVTRPWVSGAAFITGLHSFVLDPSDPITGFLPDQPTE